MLAELLVEAGRVGQAEQILDLLKEQELKDVVTAAVPAPRRGSSRSSFLSPSRTLKSELPDLEKKARVIEESSLAYAQIQAKTVAHRQPKTPSSSRSAQSFSRKDRNIQSVLTSKIFPELDRAIRTRSAFRGHHEKLSSGLACQARPASDRHSLVAWRRPRVRHRRHCQRAKEVVLHASLRRHPQQGI